MNMQAEGASSDFFDVEVACADGYSLNARYFSPSGNVSTGRAVVVAPATGVQARFYWRYAAYLASHGLGVLVPDYRGIGRSRPNGSRASLRGFPVRWHEWGTLDIDGCIRWLVQMLGDEVPLSAVGHSFGGFAVPLAENAHRLDRLLTVGAQHAHWQDYAWNHRLALFLKWHLSMPAIATIIGYFPGERIGWLEDLPKGVALDWARGNADYARTIGAAEREVLERAAKLTLTVLSINPSDDPYATPAAARRALSYLVAAKKGEVYLDPEALAVNEIGHFGLFRQRFSESFWPQTFAWLTRETATTAW